MRKLVHFSVERPWGVVGLTLGLTLLFAAQLSRIKTNTDQGDIYIIVKYP